MPIDSVDPRTAHERLAAADDAVLIDVRTVEEYEAGHPEGAINIPWALRGPAGMTPNPDFLPTVRKHVDPGRPVFVSCQMGGRSMKACQDLEGAGYGRLVNVDGGFGGRPDPATGRMVVTGWRDEGLPVETGPSGYEGLRAG